MLDGKKYNTLTIASVTEDIIISEGVLDNIYRTYGIIDLYKYILDKKIDYNNMLEEKEKVKKIIFEQHPELKHKVAKSYMQVNSKKEALEKIKYYYMLNYGENIKICSEKKLIKNNKCNINN